MHAVGFYHQQSTTERDDFVKILWENIESGHEQNFNKYEASKVTSYGIEYDYGSVMHYSEKAFSKNNQSTIEPLVYWHFNTQFKFVNYFIYIVNLILSL